MPEEVETQSEEVEDTSKVKSGFDLENTSEVSIWEKLKANKGKILAGVLGILVFAGAVFAGYEFLHPRKVKAAEIIKKSLEKILEKGTIYHHKASYYRLSLEPNQPEPTPTIYEIWEDQDSDRFKQEVIYPDGKRVIQVFDGDIRWDYNEEENTLRKDIYIYHDSEEKEIKHGERLDLIKMYRDLLDNGILKAYEGELEGRKVWQIIDERATTGLSYWDTFYFDKETFMLLQQEKWEEKEGRKVRTEKMTYEIMESIPKQNIDITKIFLFDYPLPQNTKVLERHFDISTGYVESDYYPVTPTPDPTANWETYTNTKYGYFLKYPPGLEESTEGTYSTLFDQVGQVGIGVPTFYVSIIPEGFRWQPGAIYNVPLPGFLDSLLSMSVGEEKSSRSDLSEWNTFKRLPDTSVNSESGIVYENYQVWQYPGTDRRILVKRKEYTYMIGLYYQTIDELNTFNLMLSTFRFCDPCPQFIPPYPEACKDGTWVPGEIDECGCQGPSRCIRETTP